MRILPEQCCSLTALFKLVVKNYLPLCRRLWVAVLFLTAIICISCWIDYSLLWVWVKIVWFFLSCFLTAFAALYCLDQTYFYFLGETRSPQSSLLALRSRFFTLLSGVFLLLMPLLVTHFLLGNATHASAINFQSILVSAFVIYFYLLYYFLLPLLLIDGTAFFKAVLLAPSMMIKHWIDVFFLYIFTLFILYTVSINTRHMMYFYQHYYHYPFILLVLMLLVPFYMSVVVLLFNDIKLRALDPSE